MFTQFVCKISYRIITGYSPFFKSCHSVWHLWLSTDLWLNPQTWVTRHSYQGRSHDGLLPPKHSVLTLEGSQGFAIETLGALGPAAPSVPLNFTDLVVLTEDVTWLHPDLSETARQTRTSFPRCPASFGPGLLVGAASLLSAGTAPAT